jgi:hypothetical protein
LAVEVATGIGHREVHVGSRLLDGSEVGKDLPVEGKHLGIEAPTLPFLVEEKPIEGLIAEVLLEVAATVVVDNIEFRHRHPFGVKMTAIGEEGLILSNVLVDAANGR